LQHQAGGAMAGRNIWATFRILRYSLILLLFPFVHYTGFLATDADKAAAQKLADSFHAQMAHGDSDGIYDNADQAFQHAVSRQHHDAYLAAIARNWGTPLDCTPDNIGVKYGLGAKSLAAECTTRFSTGYTAIEKFRWKKTDADYHLSYYAIQAQ
jgi:hypothetical protein